MNTRLRNSRESHGRLRGGAMKFLFFIISAIVAAPILRSALAQGVDTNDARKRGAQEIRAGGPVFPADSSQVEWQGNRWPADVEQYRLSAKWRALESTAGLDVTGAGREKIIESMVDRYRQAGVPEEEIRFLKGIAPAAISGWSGKYEERNAQSASQQDSGEIADWGDFLKRVVLPKNDPKFRATQFLIALQEKEAQSIVDLDRLSQSGPLPEFADERVRRPPQQGSPGSPPPNQNIIVRSSEQNRNDLRSLQEAPYLLAANLSYPHNPAALTDPSEQLPSILAGDQRKVESVAFGTRGDVNSAAGTGETNKILGIAPPGAPFAEAIVQQAITDAALRRATEEAQRRLDLANRANTFFSPSASNVGGLFQPTDLLNRLTDLFGGGSGGSGGSDAGLPPNLNTIPSERRNTNNSAVCDARTPTITESEAKAAAVLMGLPVPATGAGPWVTGYVPAESLYSIEGTIGDSIQTFRVGQEHFSPPDSCVWTVSRVGSSGADIAMIEDRRATDIRKILLGVSF